jgi:DNA helicase-2/ATP-dependent DNA helicase PcrA
VSLSKAQKQIVDCTDKNIIVCAGSGSGKTRTLTERVKRILSSGADPKKIVVITFTNMAADELRSRLDGVKGIDK